jgi:hypothetical protein
VVRFPWIKIGNLGILGYWGIGMRQHGKCTHAAAEDGEAKIYAKEKIGRQHER